MFWLKKFISRFFFPVPLCLEIILFGLILLWFTRRQRAGKVILTIGASILFLFSNGTFSRKLLEPLEQQYAPFAMDSRGSKPVGDSISWIVVLGGGNKANKSIPAGAQLEAGTLYRLTEGVRIHRLFPNTKLLLSGGAVFGAHSDARSMALVAKEMGIQNDNLVLESESRDTRQQAEKIHPIIGKSPFILVTSASHMPRSMALFKKLGMAPLPAPAEFLASRTVYQGPQAWFPSASHLRNSETAAYEYLGLIFAKTRGYI